MTTKQQRFCDEYLIDLNATQAAIRAGYAESTASNASRWLDEKNPEKYNPEMAEYINKRLDEVSSELIAGQEEVLKYLTSVLRGEAQSEVVVIEGYGNGETEARTIKKHPDEKEKLKAAELIGKRYGLYTEKIDADIDAELNIKIDYGEQ